MTANSSFDRDLERWLEAEAPATGPAGLHAAMIDRARTTRQRPGWLAGARGGMPGSARATGRPGIRVAYVLVILGLVLAALLAAMAAGAFRRDPVTPVGRNGSIAYFWQGNRQTGSRGGTFVMDADGTGGQQLAGAGCPSFSANGTLLAYVAGDEPGTFVANPDGSSPRPVTGIHPSYGGLGPDSGHALSPDGTHIAWWSARDELWVSPTAGGPAVRIVPPSGDPQERMLAPVWSRDGLRIAFARMVSVGKGITASAYRSAIDVVDADGSNLRHLTTRPGTWTDVGMIAWSPDSRFIAYTGLQDGSPIPQPSADGYATPNDIFVIGVDGTGDRPLTSTPGDESLPAWSPDGGQLAWVSQAGDAHKLTTVGMDGLTPLGSPVQGPESGWFTWSPDGTALLFMGRRAGGLRGDALMLVDPGFRQAPTTLRDLDGTLLCPPSWQRLNP